MSSKVLKQLKELRCKQPLLKIYYGNFVWSEELQQQFQFQVNFRRRQSSFEIELQFFSSNRLLANIKSLQGYLKQKIDIRASGEVRAEGPNRASAATLGKMGIKIQTTSPPPHRLNQRKIIQITQGVILIQRTVLEIFWPS